MGIEKNFRFKYRSHLFPSVRHLCQLRAQMYTYKLNSLFEDDLKNVFFIL